MTKTHTLLSKTKCRVVAPGSDEFCTHGPQLSVRGHGSSWIRDISIFDFHRKMRSTHLSLALTFITPASCQSPHYRYHITTHHHYHCTIITAATSLIK